MFRVTIPPGLSPDTGKLFPEGCSGLDITSSSLWLPDRLEWLGLAATVWLAEECFGHDGAEVKP